MGVLLGSMEGRGGCRSGQKLSRDAGAEWAWADPLVFFLSGYLETVKSTLNIAKSEANISALLKKHKEYFKNMLAHTTASPSFHVPV